MTATLLTDVTIANGQTASEAIQMGHGGSLTNENTKTLQGVIIPTEFDGTSISFQVSRDNVTYYNLYDQTNALVSLTVAADRAYALPADKFNGWAYLKIVAGTTQTGDTTLTASLFDV